MMSFPSPAPWTLEDLSRLYVGRRLYANDGRLIAVLYAHGRERQPVKRGAVTVTRPVVAWDAQDVADAAAILAAPFAIPVVKALQALLDWGREHTSPRDANSPHALLIAAQEALDAYTWAGVQEGDEGDYDARAERAAEQMASDRADMANPGDLDPRFDPAQE